MRFDPSIIALQISNLLLQYPELAEDDALRADMVEGSTDAHEFLRQIEGRRRDTESLIKGLELTIAELQERLARLERRSAAMRQLMFKTMEQADLRKVELPEATLSVSNGQARVIITDETALPDTLCRFTRSPDKTRIKELLKSGAEVRGAVLSNSEPHISIRTR